MANKTEIYDGRVDHPQHLIIENSESLHKYDKPFEVPSKFQGKLGDYDIPREIRAHLMVLLNFVCFLLVKGLSLLYVFMESSTLVILEEILKILELKLVKGKWEDYKFLHDIIESLKGGEEKRIIHDRVSHHRYVIDVDENIESFHEFIKRVPLVQFFSVPSKAGSKLRLAYIPQEIRSHLKALIDFVCFLHDNGLTLRNGFVESNLFIKDGILKFRGLQFVEGSKSKDTMRDYIFLHNIIKSLKGKRCRCESLEDLLRMLKNDRGNIKFGTKYELMLQNHFALVSHDTSVDYITSFYHDRNFLQGEYQTKYLAALKNMSRSKINNADWTHRYRARCSGLGPALDIFHYNHRKGADPPKKKQKTNSYKGTGGDEGVNRSILQFCRNLGTHLHQYMRDYTGSRCNKKDVDWLYSRLNCCHSTGYCSNMVLPINLNQVINNLSSVSSVMKARSEQKEKDEKVVYSLL